jgi:hypothetical protein
VPPSTAMAIIGIFWRLHTGVPWPDIPERYGSVI